MKLPLTLRWSEQPLGSACAWLIPGNDPHDWLVELARWGLPQAELELLVVARADGAAFVGLLVLPPAGTKPVMGSRAIPYRRMAERLYLPLDARIDPDVTQRELAELLTSSEGRYVWHPVAGLLAFSKEETRRVHQLLVRPGEGETRWDCALPGAAINRRLVSIAPAQSMSLEQMLREARGDIGSESPQELPQRQDESPGKLAEFKQAAAAQVGRFVEWLTSESGRAAGEAPERNSPASAGGSKPSWLESLRKWAQQQQHQWNEKVAAARNRELTRLLEMLEKRPDEGLRYAIPFGGEAGRGIAPPGTSLVSRNVDFSLSGLGGGGSGAADIWEIEARYRRELTERYRALASREIALGRHRRAAYIFAELLNDLRSAASTLEDGKHYREAAALYQERLKSDRDAARCLCRGGLWTEAIALYEKLGEHEQVGDLYAQLEDREQACVAWRRAIDVRRQASDWLGAARIWQEKIKDDEATYQELLHGWPESGQAADCLDRAFDLLGSLGRHEETQRQIAALPHTLSGAGRMRMLVERLARVAVKYPDAAARLSAADQTRVLAAARFEVATVDEVPALTAALRSLATGDRLLARDCQRFLEGRQRRATPRLPHAKPRPPARQVTLLRQLAHPDFEHVANVLGTGKAFYLIGSTQAGNTCFARGRWDGMHRQLLGVHGPRRASAGILLAGCHHTSTLFYQPLEADSVKCGAEAFPDQGWLVDIDRVEQHASFDHRTVGIAAEGGKLVSVYAGEAEDLVVINTFLTVERKLASSHTLRLVSVNVEKVFDLASPEEPPGLRPSIPRPLPMLLRGGTLLMGFGPQLAICDGTQTQWIEMQQPIQSIAASRAFTRDRIAVMHAGGGELLWGLKGDSPRERFAQDLGDAKACFTDGGWLVAANRSEIQVYHTSQGANSPSGKLTWLASIPGPNEEVVGLMGTEEPNEVALCTALGEIRVYRLPGP